MTNVLGQEGTQCATVFAFQVLPTIIFIAALFAMLYAASASCRSSCAPLPW